MAEMAFAWGATVAAVTVDKTDSAMRAVETEAWAMTVALVEVTMEVAVRVQVLPLWTLSGYSSRRC